MLKYLTSGRPTYPIPVFEELTQIFPDAFFSLDMDHYALCVTEEVYLPDVPQSIPTWLYGLLSAELMDCVTAYSGTNNSVSIHFNIKRLIKLQLSLR